VVPQVNVVENASNGQSCFSTTGDRIYTASGAPYDFPATSVATSQVIQTLPGSNYPDAIQCVWNGLAIGGIDGYYQADDIFVYFGLTGVSLGQPSSNGPSSAYRDLLSRGLAVSADGTMPSSYAASVSRLLTIATQPLPIKLKPIPITAYWHQSKDNDRAHEWFRRLVIEMGGVIQELHER
jgi:hypothetical protein